MKRNRSPTNKPVMKRYATLDSSIGSRSVLDRSSFGSRSFSYHSPIVLLSFSYCSPIVLLSFSYCSPIVLLLFSYRSPIVLLSFSYWETENNTETIRNGAKDERMRLGGTRVINLTIIYL